MQRKHNFPVSFPHQYFYFGSVNSADEDVLILVEEIPDNQETAIQYLKDLNKRFGVNWNANMVVIRDGMIIDTIASKGSPDSVAFSLRDTYEYHQQRYAFPVYNYTDRHFLLSVYKAVRTILNSCSRTEFRIAIKPYLKGCHPFSYKLKSLECLDFTEIEILNPKYDTEENVWKRIAFYLAQSYHYLDTGEYITNKNKIVETFPFTKNFIERNVITTQDKKFLNAMKTMYLELLYKYDFRDVESGILALGEEMIDMSKEKAIQL